MKKKGLKRWIAKSLIVIMILASLPSMTGFAGEVPYLLKGGLDVYRTVPSGFLTRSDTFDKSRYQNIAIGTIFGHAVYGLSANLFSGCGVEHVQLPNTLHTIGASAFESNALAGAIVIPGSVTTIDTRAFYHNPGITSLVWGSEITRIGNEAFKDTGIGGVLFLPPSITYLGVGAFADCLLFDVLIPESMRVIGAGAFSGYMGSGIGLPVNPVPKDYYIYNGWENSNGELVTFIAPRELDPNALDLGYERSYTPIAFGLTYMLDGGENGAENPSAYTVEDTVLLNDATKAGYSFAGWYSDSELTQRVTTIPVGSIGEKTLYAKWAENYEILYQINEGVNPDSNPSVYSELSPLITLQPATKSGYRFIGWYTDLEFTSPITEIPHGSTGDVEVFASYTKKYYVTYELDEGSNDPSNPQVFTALDDTVRLEDAAKTGYSFVGWYLDAEMTQKTTEIPSGTQGDMTLFAKWTKRYHIEYVLNGGQINQSAPDFYTSIDDTIILESPMKNFYRFAGWYLNSNFSEPITEITAGSTGDLAVYAKWLFIYTVFYDEPLGVNPFENPVEFTEEDPTIVLKPASRKGATFIGWFDLSDHEVATIPQGTTTNIVLFSKWDFTTYTITHDDVYLAPDSSYIDSYNSTALDIQIPEFFMVEGNELPVKMLGSNSFEEHGLLHVILPESLEIIDEYAFAYNRLDRVTIPNGVVDINDSAFETNEIQELYLGESLEWIGDYAFCDNQLVTVILPDRVEYVGCYAFIGNEFLTVIDLPSAVPMGYSEVHWTDLTSQSTVTQIIDFTHAYMKEGTPIEYAITYDLGEGENAAGNPAFYTVESDAIELEVPTRFGCVFEGWYLDREFTQVVTRIEEGQTGNLDLYAKWRILNRYTVDFAWSGNGSVTPNTIQELFEGQNLDFIVTPNEGNIVDEVTSAKGHTIDEEQGVYTLLNIQEDDAVSIVFSDTCDLDFDSREGSAVAPIVDIPYGQSVLAPEPPTKKGFDFSGWYQELAFENPWNFDQDGVTSNLTLYAKWSPQTLVGSVSIEGLAEWNEVLQCNISGITNGTGAVAYQWFREIQEIAGAINATYRLVAEDMEKGIRVVVTTSEQLGQLASDATQPVAKATPALPDAPVLLSRSTRAISVVEIVGNEYSIDGGATWQEENHFLGLEVSAVYEVVQRVKASQTSLGSEASLPLDVKTHANPSTGGGGVSSPVIQPMETVIPRDVKGVDEVISIERDQIKVLFNGKAFAGMEAQKVAIRIELMDLRALNLTEAQRAEIGNLPVFDISLWIGGEKAEYESEEPIVIEFSFESKLENHKIVAVYIDEAGRVQILDGIYDGTQIRFETNHLSCYSLMYIDQQFEDLENYTWAKEAVEALAARGVIQGTGAQAYSPEQNISRADFVTLIMRMFALEAELSESYRDVAAHQYYSDFISMAKTLGILSSQEDQFHPFMPITRQDMMVILSKALKISGKAEKLYLSEKTYRTFDDSEMVAEDAIEDVDFMIRADIIHGMENRINPLATTTRAEVAQMLYNVMGKLYGR
jgi:uncharacterized repeat protein (TIGR02543 family)